MFIILKVILCKKTLGKLLFAISLIFTQLFMEDILNRTYSFQNQTIQKSVQKSVAFLTAPNTQLTYWFSLFSKKQNMLLFTAKLHKKVTR